VVNVVNNNIIIREERADDFLEAEYMTKKAFWNLHGPGCNEHYLLHKIRQDNSYISELTRVAIYKGKVVGGIYYTKSYIDTGTKKVETITFGPLCVDPEFQNHGIGKNLLKVTIEKAKELGYKAAIIFGEPDYYPKYGFVTCDCYGITTADGKNFNAFMCLELEEGTLKNSKGKFYIAKVYEDLPETAVEEYDKKFPYMEKRRI